MGLDEVLVVLNLKLKLQKARLVLLKNRLQLLKEGYQ